MTTVVIVGAHGNIARQLTRRLVAAGDTVRGVIRSPAQAADLRADGAEPILHDLEVGPVNALIDQIAGADALVFAAGAGGGSGVLRKRTVDLGGSLAAIDAADQAGVRRLVQVSFVGAGLPTPPDTEEVFAAYWDAKRQADRALRGSGLDWTIIKPGRLLDLPATGRGTVSAVEVTGVQSDERRGGSTRRADVAELLALVLAEPRSVGTDLVVFEGDQPLPDALAAAVR